MAKRKNAEDQTGTPRPGPSSSRRKAGVEVWVVLTLLAGLFIGYLMGRSTPPPPPTPAPSAQNATEAPAPSPLAQQAEGADKALHAALSPEHQGLKPKSMEQREHAGQAYAYRSYELPLHASQALHERFVKELAQLAPQAKLNRPGPEAWDVSVDGLPVLRLRFEPQAAKPASEPTPSAPARHRLALVIDDMGEDVAIAKELAALGVPVAFSIWPDSSHREAVLKIAKAAGREILIHLPMEPKGYPKMNPGPHAILLRMEPAEVRQAVDRAVERVHGAVGVNNHMGSAFTESHLGMRMALGELKAKGLFFLDSRTSAATVGLAEAKRLGMRAYERNVFLDNEQDEAAILKQLRKAEAQARKNGQAIAIGHPHPQTVAAIRQWLKEKGPDVQLSTVSGLSPR